MDLMEEKLIALAKEKELIEKVSGPPYSASNYLLTGILLSKILQLKTSNWRWHNTSVVALLRD
jgi:hypothetical protein